MEQRKIIVIAARGIQTITRNAVGIEEQQHICFANGAVGSNIK